MKIISTTNKFNKTQKKFFQYLVSTNVKKKKKKKKKLIELIYILRRSLEKFSPAHYSAALQTDPDNNGGELVVTVPQEASGIVSEGRNLRVGVEFSLENPQGGVHFVIPEGEGSLAEV